MAPPRVFPRVRTGTPGELRPTRLIPMDKASAVPRPAEISDTYLELEHGAKGDEQRHLHRAGALVAARSPAERAAALTPFLAESSFLVGEHRPVVTGSRERLTAVQDALAPWRRRSGSSLGYTTRCLLLFGGEVVGPANAAILYGDVPTLAVVQAVSVGTAVVTAGLVGKQWRHQQLAKERERVNLSSLDTNLSPFLYLFDGSELRGRHWVRAVLGVAATIGILVGAAVLSLRSAVDGAASGVAFGFMAVAVSAASFVNAYSHADQVSDLIDQSQKDYRSALRRHRRLPLHPAHLMAGSLSARVRSVEGEHEHHGHAAAANMEARMHSALAANPDVVGHGPAPTHLGRRPRTAKS